MKADKLEIAGRQIKSVTYIGPHRTGYTCVVKIDAQLKDAAEDYLWSFQFHHLSSFGSCSVLEA